MKVIEIKELTKKFNDFCAVDAISLDVEQGEIFGLLGPNGAGKTTTIKMLATLLKVTSGSAKVCGCDVTENSDEVRRCIGIVFQDPAIDTELTGWENLDFHARIYGMKGREKKKRIDEVLELVGLQDKAKALVKTYSGGMKRRLEIARGLMHYPKVLFLDEPTLGLDAQTRRAIWEHIRKINKKEKITIILTTHYMEEADYLCKRVAIIDNGKILALDTPSKLKDSMGGDVITIKLSSTKKFQKAVKKYKWISKVSQCNGNLCLSLEKGETKIPEIIKIAEKLKIKVESISISKPTLEDVFIRFTGKKIRSEVADSKNIMRMRARMHG